MDMGSMGGMGDGSMAGPACKISMLWNWDTVDSCFLAASWHNHTKAQFAGTVIGIFLMVVAIEGVRRLGREYDRRLVAVATAKVALAADKGQGSDADNKSDDAIQPITVKKQGSVKVAPTWPQQLLRGAIYGTHFTGAFLVMLFGMYFNGFVLFAIFIGGFVGNTLFAGDTVGTVGEVEKSESGCCC